MWQGQRWVVVVLSAAVASSMCLGASGPALAAAAGTEVLDWKVSGSVEGGGMYEFGENGSSKFNEYRDMDSGFVGDLSLRGEKKEQPYYFDLRAKNPARDDQLYEGEFGRYGLFRLDLGWDRTPHVLSNTARTIFQDNRGNFTLPSTLRATINTIFAGGTANRANIQATIDGLARPVDLGFNTDVGFAGFKLTPTESLTFDLEYTNRRNEGTRPASAVMASNLLTELAIPIDQITHEAKFGVEFARPNYGFQLGYTGSFFDNQFQGYSFDNQLTSAGTQARGEFSAPPDNKAHTFSLTGRAGLPWWRTNVSGTLSYSMLRQDETFLTNVAAGLAGATNADSEGRTSPDAKTDLVAGNIVLTSRPLNNVTATARYRYFEHQNDMPIHSFVDTVAYNGNVVAGTFATKQERFTKQNAGLDLGWRPIRRVSLKTGYEYEHWNRADIDGQSFSTTEHIAKAAVDVTPLDWLLGRVTYTYGDRYLYDYGRDPRSGPSFYKFNYADRVRNRADLLLQLSRWETFTPSFNFGYAYDNYYNSNFGLTDDKNLSAGVGLGWTPISRLTLSADYTYERHDTTQRSPGSNTLPGHPNDFESKSKDEFHIVGLGAIVDVIPKIFDINLGYSVSFGYTTIKATNLNPAFTTAAGNFDKIQNVLQTFRIVGRYRLTEKLSMRGGFAYERYNERNFARDPMQTYLGFIDSSTSAAASQSVYLGATVPNYEAYIVSALVRYDF